MARIASSFTVKTLGITTLCTTLLIGITACVNDATNKAEVDNANNLHASAAGSSNNSHYPRYSQERRGDLASQLKDLANHVDGHVKFGNGANMSSDDLLAEIYKNRPQLQTSFATFNIKIKVEDGHSAVLLCDAHRELLEDSGCTANIDANYWQQEVSQSCEFKLDLAMICQ